MNITAINDEDRRRHFNRFDSKLLRRIRTIKNENYDKSMERRSDRVREK